MARGKHSVTKKKGVKEPIELLLSIVVMLFIKKNNVFIFLFIKLQFVGSTKDWFGLGIDAFDVAQIKRWGLVAGAGRGNAAAERQHRRLVQQGVGDRGGPRREGGVEHADRRQLDPRQGIPSAQHGTHLAVPVAPSLLLSPCYSQHFSRFI